jgi:hypothetical protein
LVPVPRAGARGWLLLIHQLPPTPDYLRVKVRRRLQGIGALALKNSVYVLPDTAEALEDFQWLRREIVSVGGEATLCASDFIEGITDAELEERFRAERNVEYEAVQESARAVGAHPRPQDLERLGRQLKQAAGRDHFGAAGRVAAERAIRDVEARLGSSGRAPAGESSGGAQVRPSGAVWVTRSGVHVDRIASAWLIRRFIDAAARFRFVAATGHRRRRGELRFDMFEGEFTHEGERCTLETLCARYGLREPALVAIGEIVHDIDCKDEKFGRPETEGIATVIRGICLGHPDDAGRLEAGRAVFDGLYEQFRRSA